MVCTGLGPNIIVCGPTRLARRLRSHCIVCERAANKVLRFDGVYYGYTEFCMGCRSVTVDGVLDRTRHGDRPYWRGLWAEALPPREFERRVREIEHSYFEDD